MLEHTLWLLLSLKSNNGSWRLVQILCLTEHSLFFPGLRHAVSDSRWFSFAYQQLAQSMPLA
jgi:hypothetical protein